AAIVLGVLNSAAYHSASIIGWIPDLHLTDTELVSVLVGSDIVLGVVALSLLPAAIAHDTEELREDSYIGPPSALVAGLVVITVWQIAPLAMAAGAIVIISISSRVSASWTIPAVCASILSSLIAQLAFEPQHAGIQWSSIGFTAAITVLLVGVGTVRGQHLRTLRRSARVRQSR
ncbi:MAG TPA: hypothetical protein VK065_07040, partial [Brevibacterium sp.]|nr:hypothetical protein [Brevibacterium sp.]